MPFRSRTRKVVAGLALAIALLFAWAGIRHLLRPRPPPATAEQRAQAANVHILRDSYGVPHIFGKRDADTAFGLAYAHAEDDFPTIQLVLAATQGRLGLLVLSQTALANDYYVALAHIRQNGDTGYVHIDPDARAVLDGYAAGLNYYAALHPGEADGRLFPVRGEDIAAGFEHKLPLMLGVPEALQLVNGDTPLEVGDDLRIKAAAALGSNAHAVARARSTDDVTRLNVNSHQPWSGPVAWYEAQLHSEEGWDMTGGLFPGAPVILHGHNQHLGWAHTVNRFHAIDIYKLDMIDETHYRYGEGARELEAGEAELQLDIGLFTLKLHKATYSSVHGPVMKTRKGVYAVRWPGRGGGALAAEQWLRMNKARNIDEWKAAMRLQGIPMFNTVYADRDDIGYVYNGLIPERSTDGITVLPGSDPGALWTGTVPFDDLPQVWNPPAGFVFNCNTTPFRATEGEGNPNPDDYPENMGIESSLNNRGLRSLELFGGTAKISGAEFERYKFDRTYSKQSALYRNVIEPILAIPDPDEKEKQAQELLRGWDGKADEDETPVALAFESWRTVNAHAHDRDLDRAALAREGLDIAIEKLERRYGQLEIPLGELQRLRRGQVDLPLGGGPDLLNAADTEEKDGHLVGMQGDSYILLVDFAAGGVHSRSISNYGASNRPGNAHYADQSPLFVKRQLKPVWRTEAELRAHLEREYLPGAEPR